jgi:predicted nucleic acid-binding Zn ribbon protein
LPDRRIVRAPRRRGPRELAHAVAALRRRSAPPTLLARVQDRWADAVGPAVAAESDPIAERGGTVTVGCRSSVWAAELSLLAPTIQEQLNEVLGGDGKVAALRFAVRPLP